jgi:hypothetical protein
LAFYKRSIFLINPSFQLKFSLIVCSIILISTVIYPVIIYDFFNLVTTNLPQASEEVLSAQKDLIIYLVFIQVVILMLVFVSFIFITHKIAGPLYKLKEHLYNIREGGAIKSLAFRKGDYFTDVADEVTLFLDYIKHNYEDDFHYVEEITSYIDNLSTVIPDDKKIILIEISRRLNHIKERYKQDL